MYGERYGIEAAADEGVAAQKPPQSQRRAAQRPMIGNGDRGILRAGGKIAAAAGLKRMDRRRDPAAIEVERGE
jgi:hypothetical protein